MKKHWFVVLIALLFVCLVGCDVEEEQPAEPLVEELVVDANALNVVPAPGGVSTGTEVQLSFKDGYSIFYTVDGMEPTAASTRYEQAITIAGNTIVRAVAIHDDDSTRTSDAFAGAYFTDTVLWVDAADKATVVLDSSNRVTQLRNKAADMYHFQAVRNSGPLWVPDAMNGLPVLRFSGEQGLAMDSAIFSAPTDLTVFIVYQRGDDQISDVRWQRLFAAVGDPEEQADNLGRNIQRGAGDDPKPPTMIFAEYEGRFMGPVVLGLGAMHYTQYGIIHHGLHGDIAEVIVFRGFLDYLDEIIVEDYLVDKWGVEQFE